VETTLWHIDTSPQFEQGKLEHLVLSSLGELKLGRQAIRTQTQDAALVWSLATAPDGTTYAGTGNEGVVFRVHGSTSEKIAKTDSLVVSALALGGPDKLYAGTLPEGHLYELTSLKTGQAKVRPLVQLEKADHIWAIQYDSSRRVLFAGTGPHGLVYAVDLNGRAEVYYDSEEEHILALELERPGGDVLVGTSPNARLLRITGPGRAVALHDFPGTEVKGIARRPSGDLFLAVNTFPSPKTGTAKRSTGKKSGKRAARPKPGKSKIYRRWPSGTVEALLTQDKTHLTGIAAGPRGLVYAGTGAKGRMLAVDEDRVSYTVVDVDERQVTAISLRGRDPVFATGDSGAVYRLGPGASGLAEYRTPALDAGCVARWGRLEWRGQGRLTVQTRSGNTEEPGATWSDWSTELSRSGQAVDSPPARYVQMRVRWKRDPSAVLRSLGLYYLPLNQRAVVTKVEVDSPYRLVRPKVKAKAHAATNPEGDRPGERSPSTKLNVTWTVDAPDKDRLRYRLYYRAEDEPNWRSLLPSDKVLTARRYQWNTAAVPAGYYVVKVEASDELDNPAQSQTIHAKLSPPLVIDNQPPLVVGLKASGRQIEGTARDDFSPIDGLEYSLDGRDWRPVFPRDDLFDAGEEAFRFQLPDTLPPGPYTVAVRAYDRAQNSSSARLVVRLR
jgi:hypothetical protein